MVSYLLPALINTPILETGEKFSRDAITKPFGNFVICIKKKKNLCFHSVEVLSQLCFDRVLKNKFKIEGGKNNLCFYTDLKTLRRWT